MCAGRFHPASTHLPFITPGLDAASLATRLRSMTRNWAISKEEASDPQLVPDWPDQQTHGTPPPPLANPSWESSWSVLHLVDSSHLCQKPEAAFCEVEPGAGV